jgi:lysophospholipase L1-like esterase
MKVYHSELLLLVVLSALLFSGCASAESVKILSPLSGAIIQQVNGAADVSVTVSADIPTGGGVELILDMGTANAVSARVSSGETTYIFPAVPLGEHTIDAYVVDSLGNPLGGHDSRQRVGVGDIIIAMGDENVEGLYDDIVTDNVSADGRNGPVTDSSTGSVCGGFAPILNDLLTNALRYPHSVINIGHAGDTSANGLSTAEAALMMYPNARIWLLSYGENDAYKGVSSSKFKSNIASAITLIHGAIPGSIVYISKVMYCTSALATSYNREIGDIERNTDNVRLGADIDTLFRGNASRYDRFSGETGTWLANTGAPHPNGLGYQVMAKLWKMAIVDDAYLVSDGVISSMGDTWADKIHLDGLNNVGLSESNLLEVCECSQLPPCPPGTLFSGCGWCVKLALTGAQDFGGGTLSARVRVEQDNLPPIGATSWNQMWLSQGNTLLATTRQQDTMSKSNYDLTALVGQPGRISPVGDVTPPVTMCVSNPSQPNLANGWYSSTPTIKLMGTDSAGLPVAATYYHWDSGSDKVYSGPIVPATGIHTLYFYSVDQSLNVESTKSVVLKIDDEVRTISILSPNNKALLQHINGVADIPVMLTASNVPVGGSVQVVLDMGTQSEETKIVSSSPYAVTFSSVPLGEHTLDAYILDTTGARLSMHDEKTQVGVGDLIICMGDSITVGEVDDIYTDNWSADGRNGPYIDEYSGAEYGGYEPILNNLLTAARGYPHSVINMGHAGDTTADAVTKVAGIIAQYPTARTWLVAYGTNDATLGISSAVYKQNLLATIGQIQSAIPGATVYLPKVFYWPKPLVPEYHQVMGDIIRSTNNVDFGADLDTLFRGNASLYNNLASQPGTWLATTVCHHPNGIGCQVMAKLWKLALVDHAFLVSDGVMPTMGDLWADKIQLSGLDTLGLSEDNLLLVCEQGQSSNPPAGTVFGGGGWAVKLVLTGASDFSGGTPGVSIRVEPDSLSLIGGSSWNQMWVARDSVLLPTTRQQNTTDADDYNLSATIDHPGQITDVVDLTPPITTCTVNPPNPQNSDGSYSTAPTITLSAVDGTGLAVAATYYHWDSGSDVTYSVALTAPSGKHVLHFHSVDQSGNVEQDNTTTFTVQSVSTKPCLGRVNSLLVNR